MFAALSFLRVSRTRPPRSTFSPAIFQLGGLSVAKKWTLPCSAEFYLGGRLHAKAQPGDILINKIER